MPERPFHRARRATEILVAIVLVLAVAGCSAGSELESPAAAETPSPTAPPVGAAPEGAETEPGWSYFLQVGAFRTAAEADDSVARLALQGFDAQVYERESASGTLFRVRIGPLSTLDAVNRIKAKLSSAVGIDVSVVRVAR